MTIFLDADDKHWMIANSRQELFDTLISGLNPDSIQDLVRLAAAVYECEVDAIAIMEV